MPRRTDIESICLIGSGPIVIGQAGRVRLRGLPGAEGAARGRLPHDRRQLEPGDDHDRPGIRRPHVSRAARPRGRHRRAARASGPTRCCRRWAAARRSTSRASSHAAGVLDELGIELIGATSTRSSAPRTASSSRRRSSAAGSRCRPRASSRRSTSSTASRCRRSCGPRSRSAGTAAASPTRAEQLRRQVERGLSESPIGQVLVEESVRGWDEFELEVVRDRADNVVIVCSIENLDPMGVHTGDSVTVAPQMTLSDEAYQELRDAAIAVIRAVGVDTGGSNIQFARDRDTGELRVIEMNPRVSRSSALASKATGYPIAKVAAKLAVGYTLDEIPNDLTRHDARQLRADARLRRRQDPALRVREVPRRRPHARHADEVGRRDDGHRPHVHRGVRQGEARARRRLRVAAREPASVVPARARPARREEQRQQRERPVYRRIDSCAGEVEAARTTSTRPGASRTRRRRSATRSASSSSAPARTASGRAIEFDYCCVHAVQTFRALGYEAMMVNCNPETVSTDYDTSDRLYFEPLDAAAVLAVLRARAARRRRHPVRRPDAAEARARDRGCRLPHPRHAVRRGRPRRGPRALRRAARASSASAARSGGSPRAGRRRSTSPSGSATRCSSGRRTCSAAARCASATTPSEVRERVRRRAGPDARRPLPRERDRDRRRRAVRRRRAPTSPRSCSTSRRPACTRATRRACCPRSR